MRCDHFGASTPALRTDRHNRCRLRRRPRPASRHKAGTVRPWSAPRGCARPSRRGWRGSSALATTSGVLAGAPIGSRTAARLAALRPAIAQCGPVAAIMLGEIFRDQPPGITGGPVDDDVEIAAGSWLSPLRCLMREGAGKLQLRPKAAAASPRAGPCICPRGRHSWSRTVRCPAGTGTGTRLRWHRFARAAAWCCENSSVTCPSQPGSSGVTFTMMPQRA